MEHIMRNNEWIIIKQEKIEGKNVTSAASRLDPNGKSKYLN